MDLKQRYIDLLKKSLSDYLHVDNYYSTSMPLLWVIPNGGLWKPIRLMVAAISSLFGIVPFKADRRPLALRRELRRKGLVWTAHAHTMVGLERLDNIQFAVETVLAEDVPGDLLEAGVWRGGATIFMKAMLTVNGVHDRKVWVCDSFEGLPPPDTATYPADLNDPLHMYPYLAISEAEVRDNFARYGLLDGNVEFVKGYFEDTLQDVAVERLAVLRLDGDMYGSTMSTLEALYAKVSPGGFVIIDDFNLPGCARAVNDYRTSHAIEDEIVVIDDNGVYWRKSPAAISGRPDPMKPQLFPEGVGR